MDKNKLLIDLFESWSGEKGENISRLPSSGSYREYYRITGNSKTALGVYNEDQKENRAFIEFTKTFLIQKLPVPEVYSDDLEENIYLIEDLGDTSLFTFLQNFEDDNSFPEETVNIYKTVLEFLPKFQISAGKNMDYKYCYPRDSFDKQSMLWDLNYFKYYFLKLAKISFDEQKLEDDFNKFSEYLRETEHNYFMYRDFQSRNIMLKNNSPYFIDYQGGRKGALQYDVASLLYDAKANIPQDIREELLSHYLKNLNEYIEVNEEKFIEYFYGYALIRIMQAMGAYGFRGFYEKKIHFLKSIPFAIKNLNWLLENRPLKIDTPELSNVLRHIVLSEELKKFEALSLDYKKLTVSINSFSYKNSIPPDTSGNGGGFVFDCRAIHNPGRYEEYRTLTGKDKPVIDFLNKEESVNKFLNEVYSLVDQSVENYNKRQFTHLMINFGCTGGQHRSVYCAERLTEHLKEKYDLIIRLKHYELKG